MVRKKTTDRPGPEATPDRSGKASAIAFARVFIGVFWLFEVTVGHNWKIGGLGSGANPGWIGPDAGDVVRANIATAVADGTWSWVAWLYETVIEPNAAEFGYLVIALQVALGLFLIVGFAVRPAALMAIVMNLSTIFLGRWLVPAFFIVTQLFLIYTSAGMYYGADRWITKRLHGVHNRAARMVRWLIDLPLLTSTRAQVTVLGAAVLLAAYFLMQIAMRDTTRMNLVAMDLAVLLGLVAAGFYFGRPATDRFAVVAALLRVFVGYKLLHAIWVHVDPGVDGLPGWISSDDQREVFEAISDNHWAPLAWIVDNTILPAIGLWVVLFGVVQFAVGIALVLGYRTRLAAAAGLVYLGGLIVLGFTRHAPFVFGLLVVVLAIDSGRALGMDSRRLQDRPPRYGLPVPRVTIPVLVLLAAVNAVAAGITVVASGDIVPGDYVASTGQMTTAMVAIFSALFALGGWIQLHGEKPSPAGEPAGAVQTQPTETPTASGDPADTAPDARITHHGSTVP